MGACIAYIRENGAGFCRNGFFQTGLCWQSEKQSQCPLCRAPDRAIPHCLREELPEHWINDDGSPRFYYKESQP